MSPQSTSQTRLTKSVRAPGAVGLERDPSALKKLRTHHAEGGKQARLTNARTRRALARWLRRTANATERPHALSRTPEPLLRYRAAAVRSDLLEIAAIVEHTTNPDPRCVAELRDLLANGCDSPLYNPNIHVSELHATLDYLRAGLSRAATPSVAHRGESGRSREQRATDYTDAHAGKEIR
jgi:hypothetical protein